MHSGFQSLRSQMPMNVRAQGRGRSPRRRSSRPTSRASARSGAAAASAPRARGPFLFGEFTIADAMFAPVAFRFATYGVALEPLERDYAEALRATPALRDWADASARESETIAGGEVGL